ncbi:MAG TPA: DUF2169 domain-containing protein, partial [Byssovorax sp.]|jgi:hypothetical protein
VLDKSIIARKKTGFREIPLMYERAYGGAGFAANPFGVGVLAEASEPELTDPVDPRRVAGLGPIGRDWPERRRLLGALPRKALSEEVVDLPDDFDFEYFQCAPADQRVDYLSGDEWLVMDNLHPMAPRFSSRLPGVAGVARIYGLGAWDIPEGQLLELHADLLRVDVDDLLATLTFRGTFPLPSEAALAHVRVAAGVEQVGEPIVWPDLATAFESAPTEEAPADFASSLVPSSTLSGTMVIAEESAPSREPPFARTADVPVPTATSALPFVASAEASTLAVTGAPASFRAHPAGEPATLEDTLDPESLAPDLPFLPPATQRSTAAHEALPFAGVSRVPAMAAPSTPPPADEPPPQKAAVRWRDEPAADAPPPREAPPPAPAPLPPSPSREVKKGLYSRFGGKR